MAQPTTNYVPGVCNINTKEIAYRRKAGYFGLGLSLVVAAALFALDVNQYFRIVLVVPVFIAAIGFLQAKNKFCVGYGAAGTQNADDEGESASTVTDSSAVSADKKRARKMNLQALAIAVVVTIIFVII
jgi:hypothetical protein